MKAMLGRKLGMTQVFKDDKLIPVTLVEAGPCVITQVKPLEKGASFQIGFGEVKETDVNKPMKGHFVKAKVKPKRYLIEFKSEEAFELGQELSCDIFAEGDQASITAVSKGKGFQGVIRRWGFSGGPGGHGSHFHRAPGAIGMAATPSRVHKGTKLPGQMGSKQVTLKNVEVVDIDLDNNRIYLKGAVPGSKGTLVLIKSDAKIAEPKIEEEKDSQETQESKEARGERQEKPKDKDKKEEKAEEKAKEEVKEEGSQESEEKKEETKSAEKEKPSPSSHSEEQGDEESTKEQSNEVDPSASPQDDNKEEKKKEEPKAKEQVKESKAEKKKEQKPEKDKEKGGEIKEETKEDKVSKPQTPNPGPNKDTK